MIFRLEGIFHYYKMFPTTDGAMWFDKNDFKLHDCKSPNRILSNPCYCNSTLSRFGVVPLSLCGTCVTEETYSDILIHCSRHAAVRANYPKLMMTNSVQNYIELYGFADIQEILDFATNAGIKL